MKIGLAEIGCLYLAGGLVYLLYVVPLVLRAFKAVQSGTSPDLSGLNQTQQTFVTSLFDDAGAELEQGPAPTARQLAFLFSSILVLVVLACVFAWPWYLVGDYLDKSSGDAK